MEEPSKGGLLAMLPKSKHHMRAVFRGFLFLGLALYVLVVIASTASVEIDAAGEIEIAAGGRHLLEENLDADYKAQCAMTNYPPDYVPAGRGAFTCDQLENGAVILLVIGVLYMFLSLAVICDEFFVPSLEVMTTKYNIPDDIAGATLMAAGGSAPELFTSFIGVFLAKSNVGFGTIVGSAVFNVLFVIGCCVIFSNDVLVLTRWPLARDVTYYIFSLCMLGLFFAIITPEVIELWESIVLLLLYFGYVGVMAVNQDLHKWFVERFGTDDPNVAIINKSPSTSSITSDGVSVELVASSPEESLGGDAPVLKSPRNMMVLHKQKSINLATFRAGILEVLIGEQGVKEFAGIRLVNEIEGDAETTFKRIACKTSYEGSKEDAINKAELQEVLNIMTTTNVDANEVADIFNKLDTSGDEYIELSEFKAWYKESELKVTEQCKRAFTVIDKNKDGCIDETEFAEMLKLASKGNASDQHLEQARQALDFTKNGITLDEFTKWCIENNITGLNSIIGGDGGEDQEAECYPPVPTGSFARLYYFSIFPILFITYSTIPNVRRKSWENYYFLAFFMSIFWIGISSYFMVWWATQIGDVANIPPEIMGLTFLAAGTSVPDLLSSVIVAKQGKGDMAVSSSIGSNIFDILVGLPLPWLVYNIAFYSEGGIEVAANGLPISLAILILMLVLVLGLIVYNKWMMTKCLGYSMFVLYALFLTQFFIQEYAL